MTCFSYGSGFTATLFGCAHAGVCVCTARLALLTKPRSLRAHEGKGKFSLGNMAKQMNVIERLHSRQRMSPEEFTQVHRRDDLFLPLCARCS